jgi:hypothetical protein
MEALESPDSRPIDPCIRLGPFLMGTLDSELLFAIIGVRFRMPRGGNTHDEVILVSSAATGVCTRVQ